MINGWLYTIGSQYYCLTVKMPKKSEDKKSNISTVCFINIWLSPRQIRSFFFLLRPPSFRSVNLSPILRFTVILIDRVWIYDCLKANQNVAAATKIQHILQTCRLGKFHVISLSIYIPRTVVAFVVLFLKCLLLSLA